MHSEGANEKQMNDVKAEQVGNVTSKDFSVMSEEVNTEKFINMEMFLSEI